MEVELKSKYAILGGKSNLHGIDSDGNQSNSDDSACDSLQLCDGFTGEIDVSRVINQVEV